MNLLENLRLRLFSRRDVEGPLKFDDALFETFLAAPPDPLPAFEGPPHLALGRGYDHPRYGRFVHALGLHLKPELIVEVGSYAGGTAVGWSRALVENGRGRLVCVDMDVYTKGTFPETTRRNIRRAGLSEDRFELRSGDSKKLIPKLAQELAGQVDVYLVDADHTYEGALADLRNGLPMLKPGGLALVHDVDRKRRMDEATPEHPHPVHEAFMKVQFETGWEWCIFRFIRKHLGVLRKK